MYVEKPKIWGKSEVRPRMSIGESIFESIIDVPLPCCNKKFKQPDQFSRYPKHGEDYWGDK